MYLRCAVHESPKQWKVWLPLAELSYNSTFHTSLGCSPFKALNVYDADLGLGISLQSQGNNEVIDFLQDREVQLTTINEHLATTQNIMKMQTDKNKTDRQFQIGEQVLLKLRPYAQHSVVKKPYLKLAYKFYGPYTMIDKIGIFLYLFYHDFAKIYDPSQNLLKYTSGIMAHGVMDITPWPAALGAARSGP
jgi:hypothetical protein